MKHSFSILFWLLTNRISKKTGEAPIMVRLTVDGKRSEITSKSKIQPDKWNVNTGRMKGNSEEARVFNRSLNKMQSDLERIYDRLSDDGKFISAQAVKNTYLGKNEKQHLLLELFKYHNEQIRAQIGKGYAKGTLLRFETAYKHTSEFISYHYQKQDMFFSELKFEFITEYEHYLKSVKNISHNTVIRYLRHFKKIVLLALKNEWIDRDPFARYHMTLKEVKKGYLTKEEIKTLYLKEFGIERLDHVKDIFVFCCYTGLAYADVKKLTPDNISIGLDGEYWIFVDRTKTGSSSNIPLLPIARELIDKYEKDPMVINSGHVLPVISNQKMNAYLKEMATLCGITKHVTFHMARHTFATTVTLSNGVSIETVSSMLGHKNLKTTQVYAKVVQEKVSNDMKKLKELLGGSDLSKAINQ